MRTKLILLLIIIILNTNIYARGIPQVIVDPVVSSELHETKQIVGQVVAKQAGNIFAEVTGIIEQVLIEEGDIVQQHQLIAKIKSSRFQIAYDLALAQTENAKALLATAQLETELAKLQLQRQHDLKKTPAFSKALYQDLKNELEQAKAIELSRKAELKQRQADLALAELNLSYTNITAPFAGLIANKHIYPGLYVTANTALVELIDTENLEIAFDIPSKQLYIIKSHKIYNIIMDNKTFTASYRTAILKENSASRTVNVRLTPSKKLHKFLIPDQSINITVPLHTKDKVLTVHKDAIINSSHGLSVFVVENNTAKIKAITITKAIGNRYIVTKGLKPGDLTVIRGNERLYPNQPVKGIMQQ